MSLIRLMSTPLKRLEEIAESKIKKERKKIRVEQEDIEGLTDIEQKELANKNRLKVMLTKDQQMQDIGFKLARCINATNQNKHE